MLEYSWCCHYDKCPGYKIWKNGSFTAKQVRKQLKRTTPYQREESRFFDSNTGFVKPQITIRKY